MSRKSLKNEQYGEGSFHFIFFCNQKIYIRKEQNEGAISLLMTLRYITDNFYFSHRINKTENQPKLKHTQFLKKPKNQFRFWQKLIGLIIRQHHRQQPTDNNEQKGICS